MNKQLSFFKSTPSFFGGSLSLGKRKARRPLSTKDPIHIVLRSSWAKGEHSFLRKRHRKGILRALHFSSKKYGVRVYQTAIASNHLHLVVRIAKRECYCSFIRMLTGQIASLVMRTKSFAEFKKKDTKEIQGSEQAFWQFRPFTRILAWGRDFNICIAYVMQNQLEALGVIAYVPRTQSYERRLRRSNPTQGKRKPQSNVCPYIKNLI